MPSINSFRRQLSEWRQASRFKGYCDRFRAEKTPLPPSWQVALESLERDGAYVTNLDALDLPCSADMLDDADCLYAAMAAESTSARIAQHASRVDIESCENLLMWGLAEPILSLVELYMGKPVVYRGVTVRKDMANGVMDGTRIWHRDGEDFRILKCIVYINDVGPDGGGFQYIPRAHAPPIWRLDIYDGNRVANMDELVPESHWRACTGPRGTVVLVDPCSVYHRGQLPKSGDRQAVFFNYNSNTPLFPEHCKPLFDNEGYAMAKKLSPRQRAALEIGY